MRISRRKGREKPAALPPIAAYLGYGSSVNREVPYDIPLQQTLEELFAANRILAGEGVIDGFGHVSVRSPLQPDHYFMTRSNVGGPVEESKWSSLMRKVMSFARPMSDLDRKRFIHGEIYRARPDVMAVVHTHAPALILFGVSPTPCVRCTTCGLPCGGVPVFDIRKDHGMTNLLITRSDLPRPRGDAGELCGGSHARPRRRWSAPL